ncbi:MAG TPA: hypothetical protein VM165_11070, partial [Planctomycetaceae bacterium]|nr:hypothetical protein [Planctomycetaceae bacterium]
AAAVLIGWSLLGNAPSADADPFADLETELGAPTVSLGPASVEAVSPPSEFPASEFANLTVPTLPGFGDATDSGTATLPAHFTTEAGTAIDTSSNPVWLLGTIEPLDDTTAPSVVPLEVRQAVGSERFRR